MAWELFGEDPISNIGFRSSGQARRAMRRPLARPEEESMLRSLTDKGVSGLSYLASALDKPGRAVRGLVGGRPEELLAAVPFSDSLGLTDPSKAVSGRQITDDAGITSRSDKGWGAWGAGVGAEMLLDPLSFVTLGPKTAATATGKALSKAGLTSGMTRRNLLEGFETTAGAMRAAGETEPVIRHAVDSGRRVATDAMEAAATKAGAPIRAGDPLGGLIGLGLPFSDPSVVLGTGKASQAVAGAIDRAGDYLRFGNPIGRYLGAHFDNDVAGATDANLQRAFKSQGTPAYKEMMRVSRGQQADVTLAMDRAIKAGIPERDLVSAVNMARENVPLPPSVDPAVAAAADPIGQMMRSFAEGQATQARQIGAPFEGLKDRYIAYGPRQATAVEKGGPQMRPDRIAPPQTGSNVKRKDPFRDIPGGTEMVNRLAMQHAGLPAASIYDDVFGALTQEASRVAGGGLPQEELDFLGKRAEKLSLRLSKMKPVYREKQVPFFSPNLPATQALRGERQARSVRSTAATLEALASAARPAGDDTVSMLQAIKSLGLRTTVADPDLGLPAQGASVELLRKLARHGQGPVDDALLLDNKARREALNAWGIPKESLEPLLQHWKKWDAPSNTVQPIRVIDSATNLFKTLAYSTWFPSHFRNLTGGGVTNFFGAGAGFGDNALAFWLMRDQATAREIGQAFPHMPPGLSDAEALAWAKRDGFVNANLFNGFNAASELSGTGSELVDNVASGSRITPRPPGEGRTGTSGSFLGDMLGLFREGLFGKKGPGGEQLTSPRWFNRQAGLYDRATGELRRADEWSVSNAGRVAGTNVEDYSRLVGYLAGLRQGMAPEVAGQLTNKIHFDYGDLTDFERKVMRRLVPFYTFQSRNLPLQLENLVTRPSTITTQLRPIAAARGEYTPDWIGSGVAIPVGENEDGTQRYVSQLGLPIEDAFERMKFSGGLPDLPGTAMAYAAGLNPYLKGAVENMMDRQFFSGRRLSDLRPTTAGSLGGLLGDDASQWFTQFISNSPATRFATAFDKLIDDRKPIPLRLLNLMTGARVTDVNLEQAKAIETRNALEDLLRGRPGLSNFTNFYVRPGDEAQLDPDTVAMMQMLGMMQERARDAARDKRASGRG